MECKVNIDDKKRVQRIRFNRYIVECKAATTGSFKVRVTRFNRYIVECKVRKMLVNPRYIGDLIDTLWNVKENSLEARVAALEI